MIGQTVPPGGAADNARELSASSLMHVLYVSEAVADVMY
jgi:hypothetical protein